MSFGEAFGTFLLDMFGTLRQDTRKRLRDLLRDKGMFVERSRGMRTREALYAAAQDELPWRAEELEGLN